MLSANRLALSFIFLAFFQQVYAADVSNFDIKGIKLGESYSKVKGILPCRNTKTDRIGDKRWIDQILCGKKGGPMIGREFIVNLDHNQIIWNVMSQKNFSIEPNLQKIERQIYSKYGKPSVTGMIKTAYKSISEGYSKSYCWGSCSQRNENTEYSKGSEVREGSRKSFVVKYESFSKRYPDGDPSYSIYFSLMDPVINEANSKWMESENNKYKKKLKENESNLDL
ncbi:MAG: hypothetical protein D3921_11775 [Candidatus Electrothrix sp. AW1]|nr:hypothetical protein [Candidatus Electrothrix sp. AX1]MCI5183171.1 hypothetical protein [Candidatus Electrothrix gigas]